MTPDYRHWFLQILSVYEYGIIAYLFTLSTIYFVLLLIGFLEMMRHRFAYTRYGHGKPRFAPWRHSPIRFGCRF